MTRLSVLGVLFSLVLSVGTTAQTDQTGVLSGQVVDQNGLAVVGSEIMVALPDGSHQGRGRTDDNGYYRIGFLKPANFAGSLHLAKVCNAMNDCDMETAIVDNILDYVWSKLLINAGINALTAIHRCPNGKLLESDDTLNIMTAAVKEGEAVARAKGIQVPDDPVVLTIDVCRRTSQNLSSMLQDINNKRRTEIDSINGEIVAAGKKLGIPTPVNEDLVNKLKEIEENY